MNYEFSRAKVVSLSVRIGVDVRPPIEIALSEPRFHEFSRKARSKFPQLFDRMILGDQQFEMQKAWVVPDKAKAEVSTFVMTPRGPLFRFPIHIGEIELEPDLPNTNDTFIDCMKSFCKCFPGLKVLRVGKVHEYIFGCGDINSIQLVNDRFLKLVVPEEGAIGLRLNMCNADCNRIFTIEPIRRMRQTGSHSEPTQVGYGIKVDVDVGNRTPEKDMQEIQWQNVLNLADRFVKEEMYNILNGEEQA